MLYIHTDNPQTVTALPNNWRGVENWGRNATPREILAAGFRPYTHAEAPAGERIVTSHIEHDGTHAWQVIDATVNVEAEQAAAAQAAFMADAERLAYSNAFLLLCDRLTGGKDHRKLSFEELPGVLLAIKAANREAYEDARDAFDLINSACFKKFGIDWWDRAEWTEHPAVINAAGQILAAAGVES